MFSSVQRNENDSGIIELQGLSAKTMEILLDCIYCEKVNFTMEIVKEILAAASLFQLKGEYSRLIQGK